MAVVLHRRRGGRVRLGGCGVRAGGVAAERPAVAGEAHRDGDPGQDHGVRLPWPGAARVLPGEPLGRAAQEHSAIPRERDALHGGPQFLPALGRRPVGRRACRGHGRDAHAARAGRQHDHAAARAQPVQHVREVVHAKAQGTGARDRPRAYVLEGPDPRDVLQPDLLRGRRLRRRGRGQDVFRQAARRAVAAGMRAARGAPGQPEPLLAAPPPAGGHVAPRQGAAQHARDRGHHPGRVRPRRAGAARRHHGALQQRSRRLLRGNGAPAPRRKVRLQLGLRGRAQGVHDARRRPAGAGGEGGRAAAHVPREGLEAQADARSIRCRRGLGQAPTGRPHAVPAGRDRGARSQDWRGPRAARWPRLERKQLQPCGAGLAPAGLVVQAVRVRGGHGQRLQAHGYDRGSRRTTTTSSAARSRCASLCRSR